MAEGGTHIDESTFAYLRDVLGTLAAIIAEGAREGRFQTLPVFMVQAGIIGPLMLFFATPKLRDKMARLTRADVNISREAVVAHVQRVALAQLEGRI